LCTHDASLDLRYQALRLGDEEVPLWCLGAWPRSSLYTKGNSEEAEARCDGAVAVGLEVSSSWDWMFWDPTMHPWIWGTTR
jgi:hypothetical protein